ncbi:hypothetical protein HDU91_002447, partial [Kappamyces sp. JEL0680]
RQSYKYFDDFTPEPELLKEWRPAPPDGKIIECRYDGEWDTLLWENGYAGSLRKGGWRFCKFRIKSRWTGLISPLSLEKLEARIESMRNRWKMRERRQSNPSLPVPGDGPRRISEPSPAKPVPEDPSDTKKRKAGDELHPDSPKKLVAAPSASHLEHEEGQSEEEEEELEIGFIVGHSATRIESATDELSEDAGGTSTTSLLPSIPKPAQATPAPAISQIADKSQLRKAEPNYIPPPPAALVQPPVQLLPLAQTPASNQEELESPLEDFSTERYAGHRAALVLNTVPTTQPPQRPPTPTRAPNPSTSPASLPKPPVPSSHQEATASRKPKEQAPAASPSLTSQGKRKGGFWDTVL